MHGVTWPLRKAGLFMSYPRIHRNTHRVKDDIQDQKKTIPCCALLSFIILVKVSVFPYSP